MRRILGHKSLFRLCALAALTICLILVSRSGSSSFSPLPESAQTPTITVELQPDSPLAITSIAPAGQMAPDSQFIEFGFYVVNVSTKAISAYAIKQEVLANGMKAGGGVTLYNPQLSNSVFLPNRSTFIGDTSQIANDKKNVITLSIDFVEFADGTKWGADSVKSAERTSGQRTAAYRVSQRLLQGLNTGRVEEVMHQIEAGTDNIEPTDVRTEEWREGFRAARVSVMNRLKRTKEQQGAKEFEREVRRLSETFREKD